MNCELILTVTLVNLIAYMPPLTDWLTDWLADRLYNGLEGSGKEEWGRWLRLFWIYKVQATTTHNKAFAFPDRSAYISEASCVIRLHTSSAQLIIIIEMCRSLSRLYDRPGTNLCKNDDGWTWYVPRAPRRFDITIFTGVGAWSNMSIYVCNVNVWEFGVRKKILNWWRQLPVRPLKL